MVENRSGTSGIDENIAGLLWALHIGLGHGIDLLSDRQASASCAFMRRNPSWCLAACTSIYYILIRIFFTSLTGGLFSLGALLLDLVRLLGTVLWIVLMVKAYQGERFKVPVAGDIAESLAKR